MNGFCEKIATDYFLGEMGWPSIIPAIAVIAGILTYGYLINSSKFRPSQYIFWVIIAVIVFVTYLILSAIARMNINGQEYYDLVGKCQRCLEDPYRNPTVPVSLDTILQYVGRKNTPKEKPTKENFEGDEEETIEESAELEEETTNENITQTTKKQTEEEEEKKETAESFSNFAPLQLAFPTSKTQTGYQYNTTFEQSGIAQGAIPVAMSYDESLPLSIANSNYANPQEVGNFLPEPVSEETQCMKGSSPCGYECTGTSPSSCNTPIVRPIPGPSWQPLSAATMQKRIARGEFTPSTCPILR